MHTLESFGIMSVPKRPMLSELILPCTNPLAWMNSSASTRRLENIIIKEINKIDKRQ